MIFFFFYKSCYISKKAQNASKYTKSTKKSPTKKTQRDPHPKTYNHPTITRPWNIPSF